MTSNFSPGSQITEGRWRAIFLWLFDVYPSCNSSNDTLIMKVCVGRHLMANSGLRHKRGSNLSRHTKDVCMYIYLWGYGKIYVQQTGVWGRSWKATKANCGGEQGQTINFQRKYFFNSPNKNFPDGESSLLKNQLLQCTDKSIFVNTFFRHEPINLDRSNFFPEKPWNY